MPGGEAIRWVRQRHSRATSVPFFGKAGADSAQAVACAGARPAGTGALREPDGVGTPAAACRRSARRRPPRRPSTSTPTRPSRSLERLRDWVGRGARAGLRRRRYGDDALDAMPCRSRRLLAGAGAGQGLLRAAAAPRRFRSLRRRPRAGADPDPRRARRDQARCFEDPSVLKIGQNLKYDWVVLKRHGIEVAPFDDTMLISYVLDAGKGSHGMDELSRRHLGHTPITFAEVAGTGRSKVTFDKVEISTRPPPTRPRMRTSPCASGRC